MSLTDTRIKTAKPAEKIYKIYDADGFHRPYIHNKEKEKWNVVALVVSYH